jgi:hypothetical protein
VTKEIGVLKVVPLLKSASSEQRYEACRILTNITNKQGMCVPSIHCAHHTLTNHRREIDQEAHQLHSVLWRDHTAEVQKAAVKEGVLGLLLSIATNHKDNNRKTQTAALVRPCHVAPAQERALDVRTLTSKCLLALCACEERGGEHPRVGRRQGDGHGR